MDLLSFKQRFDPVLESVLEEKLGMYQDLTTDSLLQSSVFHLKTLAMSGGKRVRPYLAFLMYRAAGGLEEESALHVLTALELFHLFALVHDDIADEGAVRHGVPTAHVFVAHELHTLARRGNTTRVSEAQAVLLGDILLTLSHEVFLDAELAGVSVRKARELFFAMTHEVITGQMIDIDLTTRAETTEDIIMQKNLLKTAQYTMVRPMQIGSALATDSPELLDWCSDFGRPLGIAFQIQDDLLDLGSSTAELGKSAMNDLRAGQHTLITQYVFEHGSAEAVDMLQSFFGKPFVVAEEHNIRDMLESSGALAYAKKMMSEQYDLAGTVLEKSSLDPEVLQTLRAFVQMLRARTA